MINNLEGISFESVIGKQGQTYISFRQKLSPHYRKVWLDIGLGWLFLMLPLAVNLVFPRIIHWWLMPVYTMYFGYLLAYLHLFIHEAAHFNLHYRKRTNDRLAATFLCPFFGISLKDYRKTHWVHHLHLSTPDDQEISYYNALTFPFFIRMISGLHLYHILKTRSRGRKLHMKFGSGRLMITFISTLALHLLFLSLCFYSGSWPLLTGWVGGIALIFPLLATLRQILEHREEIAGRDSRYYAQSRTKVSRLFGKGIFSRTFGSAGFNRHMIHHWDPHISYTRMTDILEFLRQSPQTKEIIQHSTTSYYAVFSRLIAAR